MKRLWCILLSALLILTFAVGCEPPAEEEEGWETNTGSQVLIKPESEPTPEPTPEPEPEPEPAPEPEPIPECDLESVYESALDYGGPMAKKPVIYVYPEEETRVSVKLDFKGDLTATYPAYNDGWTVTASPDGALTDLVSGRQYGYLFWEGAFDESLAEITSGFVVKGEDTAAFLEEKLSVLGLSHKEQTDFITYWLPVMQENAYNLISFDSAEYEERAKLMIDPVPDSVLRVFMTFKALEEPIEIPAQSLPTFERRGFTVVEWGGTEIK